MRRPRSFPESSHDVIQPRGDAATIVRESADQATAVGAPPAPPDRIATTEVPIKLSRYWTSQLKLSAAASLSRLRASAYAPFRIARRAA